jgi:CheY-like chemotaxis protein
MTRKLNNVLLVDDDHGANFINQMIIKQSGITDNIETTLNGKEALDYLNGTGKYEQNGTKSFPELIFLDINMPIMNGWEFLEEYNKLEEERKNKSTIILLTTSLNPEDRKKAEKISSISGFENKPLDITILEKITIIHFQSLK